MANNDFFEDKQDDSQEVEKVKVGDIELSPEELQDLVGRGQKLKELEEKQGQPVENIISDWGKRGELLGQEKKAREEALAELDKYKNPPTKEQVDQETIRKQVLEELKGYGIPTIDEVKQAVNDIYQTNRAGERMLAQVKRVAREAVADGKPEVTPEALLEFMADPSNPKDPEKAYKVMFDKELEEWKLGQINKAKGQTMTTVTKSTAGAKTFTGKTPNTKDELNAALSSVLWGESGAQ